MSGGTSSVRAVTIKRIQCKDGTSSVIVRPSLTVQDPKKTKTSHHDKHANNMFSLGDDSSDDDSGNNSREHSKSKSTKGGGHKAASSTESQAGPRRKKVIHLDDEPATPKSKSKTITTTKLPAGVASERVPRASFKANNQIPSLHKANELSVASVRSARPSKIITPRGGTGQVGDVEGLTPITPKLKASSDDEGEDDEFKKRFGANGLATGLRAARMDDGSGLDPGYQEMVKNNPLHWADPDFANLHTDQVWHHYTTHQRIGKEHVKHLDHHGLVQLADDTVERFLQRYRAEIQKTNPKFTPDVVEKSMMTEIPHTYIGAGLKTVEAIKARVVTYLKKELDKDHDKQISKMDFQMTWKTVVTRLHIIPKASKDICVIL